MIKKNSLDRITKILQSIIFSHYFVIFPAVLVGLLGFFFGERMADFGNRGDEHLFLLLAKNFPAVVFKAGLSDYHIQRIVPSALCYYTLKLLGLSTKAKNIVDIFLIFNVLLFSYISYIWVLITKELKITLRGCWLGFIALFCNFAVLKFYPYVMLSTDPYAFALGITMIYLYLRKSVWLLALTTIIGAFTWPTIVYIGTLLILFPKDEEDYPVDSKKAPLYLNYLVAIIAVVLVLIEMLKIHKGFVNGKMYLFGVFRVGGTKPIMPIIFLSIGASLYYIFISLTRLLDNAKCFDYKYFFRKINLLRIVVAFVMFFALKYAVHILAKTHNFFEVKYVIRSTFMLSVIQPATFLISHVVYFGPIVLLFYFLWKPICKMINSCGIGLMLCIFIVIFLGLNSETRTLTNFYPMIIPFLVKVTDTLNWKKSYYWSMGILSVLTSKMWLTMHYTGWDWVIDKFPTQTYYMNFGPWMSHQMYVVQGSIIIFLSAVFYILLIKDKVNDPEC